FAAIHLPETRQAFTTLFGGVVAGTIYLKTHRILLPILFHASWNFTVYILYYFSWSFFHI
ncbi:MAG: CPBP family intramembrane metalloprotease, partial [Flavobacteriales bacterium]|nr:CPBP family intramembrane metalloprotease [Flavobacteriales bacterium]